MFILWKDYLDIYNTNTCYNITLHSSSVILYELIFLYFVIYSYIYIYESLSIWI
jgi:hypothetical protein